jgi:hypothetical protein
VDVKRQSIPNNQARVPNSQGEERSEGIDCSENKEGFLIGVEGEKRIRSGGRRERNKMKLFFFTKGLHLFVSCFLLFT